MSAPRTTHGSAAEPALIFLLLLTLFLTGCASDQYLVIGGAAGANRQYVIKTEDPQAHESNNLTGGTNVHLQVNLLT